MVWHNLTLTLTLYSCYKFGYICEIFLCKSSPKICIFQIPKFQIPNFKIWCWNVAPTVTSLLKNDKLSSNFILMKENCLIQMATQKWRILRPGHRGSERLLKKQKIAQWNVRARDRWCNFYFAYKFIPTVLIATKKIEKLGSNEDEGYVHNARFIFPNPLYCSYYLYWAS